MHLKHTGYLGMSNQEHWLLGSSKSRSKLVRILELGFCQKKIIVTKIRFWFGNELLDHVEGGS